MAEVLRFDGEVAIVTGAGGRAVAEASSVASAVGGRAIVQATLDAFGSVEIRANVIMPQALDTAIGSERARHTTVDNVTPMLVYLTHGSCDFTQRISSVGCGHVGRVFVGVAPGWFAPELALPPTEEVVDHLAAASDVTGFAIVDSATKELQFMAEQIEGEHA